MIDDEAAEFLVLRNGEEQYSIWPKELTVPDGWTSAGFEGVKSACLSYIDENWTDMRPRSLRDGS